MSLSGEGEGHFVIPGWEWGPRLPHRLHCHQRVGEEEVAVTIAQQGRKLQHPNGLSLIAPWQGVRGVGLGVPSYSLSRVEVWPLHLAFAVSNGGGTPVFSVVLGLNRGIIVWKFSVSLDCFFPSPLARESRLSFGYFLSAPTGLSRLLASPAPSLGYVKLKENPILPHLILGSQDP